MKKLLLVSIAILACFSCKTRGFIENRKQEIMRTEKAFEKMASEKGLAEAFYYFADSMAVIKRENDTLIVGRENIHRYYQKHTKNVEVKWGPRFY